jgi:hypothetical protein
VADDEHAPVAARRVQEAREGVDGRGVHVVRRLVEDDDVRVAAEAGPDVRSWNCPPESGRRGCGGGRGASRDGSVVGAGETEELVGAERHVGKARTGRWRW